MGMDPNPGPNPKETQTKSSDWHYHLINHEQIFTFLCIHLCPETLIGLEAFLG